MTSSLQPKASHPFNVRILPGGEQCDARPDELLLLSLERGGIAWPSSCRNGACRTCLGQLLAGRVRYSIEWPGLSREEKEQGCVLPCVAYPLGDLVLQA